MYMFSEDPLIMQAPSLQSSSPKLQGHKTAAKFLVSQSVAGVVIGSNGTNVADIQYQTDTRIQLSRSNEHYPGTSERVMIIYGDLQGIIKAVKLIFDKVAGIDIEQLVDLSKCQIFEKKMGLAEEGDMLGGWAHCEIPTCIKLVIPAVVCGAVIGRKGDNVRRLCLKCHANISVSPKPSLPTKQAQQASIERVITIRGGPMQLHHAVTEILCLVAEEPLYIGHPGLHTVRYVISSANSKSHSLPQRLGSSRRPPNLQMHNSFPEGLNSQTSRNSPQPLFGFDESDAYLTDDSLLTRVLQAGGFTGAQESPFHMHNTTGSAMPPSGQDMRGPGKAVSGMQSGSLYESPSTCSQTYSPDRSGSDTAPNTDLLDMQRLQQALQQLMSQVPRQGGAGSEFAADKGMLGQTVGKGGRAEVAGAPNLWPFSGLL